MCRFLRIFEREGANQSLLMQFLKTFPELKKMFGVGFLLLNRHLSCIAIPGLVHKRIFSNEKVVYIV